MLRDFERDFGGTVEVSTFYDMTQAMSKLRVGAVRPDVFFPTLDTLGRLIVAGLIQPLQPAYLPHRADVWPELRHPFYDLDAAYTVPYSLYTTGLGWRNDLIGTDIAAMPNPWDAMWETAYAGHTYLLDDYREGIGLVLLRNGAVDINVTDAGDIQRAATDLVGPGGPGRPQVVRGRLHLPARGTGVAPSGMVGRHGVGAVLRRRTAGRGRTQPQLLVPEGRSRFRQQRRHGDPARRGASGPGAPVHRLPADAGARARELRVARLPAAAD